MTTRAERRAQRATIKARRLRRSTWLMLNSPKALGIAIETPKPCSCEQCGNPRRYWGDRSIQEQRHGWN